MKGIMKDVSSVGPWGPVGSWIIPPIGGSVWTLTIYFVDPRVSNLYIDNFSRSYLSSGSYSVVGYHSDIIEEGSDSCDLGSNPGMSW